MQAKGHELKETAQQPQPRLALATGGAETREECMIITWKPDAWKFLRIAKEYVRDNPDDVYSKRFYLNFLRWYAHSPGY